MERLEISYLPAYSLQRNFSCCSKKQVELIGETARYGCVKTLCLTLAAGAPGVGGSAVCAPSHRSTGQAAPLVSVVSPVQGANGRERFFQLRIVRSRLCFPDSLFAINQFAVGGARRRAARGRAVQRRAAPCSAARSHCSPSPLRCCPLPPGSSRCSRPSDARRRAGRSAPQPHGAAPYRHGGGGRGIERGVSAALRCRPDIRGGG